MATITSSVGPGGSNYIHDVALVQFMLALIHREPGVAYFKPAYTTKYSDETSAAISAFQSAKAVTGPKSPTERVGLVVPDGNTWKALNSAFAAAEAKYGGVRTCKGSSIVYFPMRSDALGEAKNSVTQASLQPSFRQQVLGLIQDCWDFTQIAWSVVPRTGGFRKFAEQEGNTSDAGYGETIHSYGYAVDLTVKNFSWVDPKLNVRTSVISFSGMTRDFYIPFYLARNTFASKLYPTKKTDDYFHLQAFEDDPLDSVGSLMALLQAVGPRKMRWKPEYRTPTDYLCDLGLGFDYYYVGTAKDIWTKDPAHTISKSDLVAAIKAKLKADPKFSVDKFFGHHTKASEKLTEGSISAADVAAVQTMLKAEFDAAAEKWREWKPVYYPDSTRRPKNPGRN